MMMAVMCCGKKYSIGFVVMWETCKFVSLLTYENIKNNPVQYIVIRDILSSGVSSLCTGWYVFFMINIDDRLFKLVSESEMWLLLALAKRLNADRKCWPSNSSLCKDTGWHIEKLQKIKKSLIEKKLISVDDRFNDQGKITSNFYQVKTSLIGIFIDLESLGGLEQPIGKSDTHQHTGKSEGGYTGKSDNKVLTIEALTNSDSKESGDSNTLFSETEKPKEKEKKVAPKKKEKLVEPSYQDMVAAWCEAYPLLGFNGASGKCINEIIAMTRNVMKGRGKEDTPDAIVNSFKYVIAYAKREKHFCDGKPLTTWNQQYLSMVHEIANGKAKPLSTREKINQL